MQPKALTGRKLSSAAVFGRRMLWRCLWVLLIAIALLQHAAERTEAAQQGSAPVRLIVRVKPGLTEDSFAAPLRAHGAAQVRAIKGMNMRVIEVDAAEAEGLLKNLRADPAIEYAERDSLARVAYIPNETTLTGTEWHLARIQAPQAWTLTAGRTNTIVAVLDSGINAAHPDFANRLVPGYNFVANTADTSDDLGHGTAVAGVVVAAGNNTFGVVGVAYGCVLMPVKVVDATGFAYYSTIAEGIQYAVEQGARVLNISIAGNEPSLTLQMAIDYAWSNNVVVVAAAGNNANDLPQYPAACSNVIAVSATETNDTLATFSSYGSFVTLAAPGDNIWTTQMELTNAYGSWRGTSFSSPIVAGTAALAASINPFLSNTQLVAVLQQNADDLGTPGWDPYFGYGRVNASRVVSAAYALRPTRPSPPHLEQVSLGWTALTGSTYRVQYLLAGSNSWTTLQPDVTATDAQASQTDQLGTATLSRTYRVRLLP